MDTELRQLAVSRVFDAPRALVFRAFATLLHLQAASADIEV